MTVKDLKSKYIIATSHVDHDSKLYSFYSFGSVEFDDGLSIDDNDTFKIQKDI